MINIKINDIPLQVEEGTTILKAARKLNIYIPTLCYLKDVNQIGACRVCLVEVKGAKALQPSCVYPVTEGLEVMTNTAKVREARKGVVELLLSNHPADCLNCVRSGNCELQNLAQQMGIPVVLQEQNSFAGVTNKMLAKGAKKICVAYTGMERFFPAEKIILTGNPVRQNLLAEIADYFRPIRDNALESGLLNPKNMGVNIKTLLYQVPGGMLSNMVSQLKEQHAEDKYYEVLEEIPRVRKDLGEPPLVTPSSQIVGTQAVFNVLMGERYKMMTKETKAVLRGEYGQTVKPFNPEVQKLALAEGEEPITCRPADLIPNELDKLEAEMAQYKEQDEDVLSYALFPQVAMDFFKYREAQKSKMDVKVADTENGAYPV